MLPSVRGCSLGVQISAEERFDRRCSRLVVFHRSICQASQLEWIYEALILRRNFRALHYRYRWRSLLT